VQRLVVVVAPRALLAASRRRTPLGDLGLTDVNAAARWKRTAASGRLVHGPLWELVRAIRGTAVMTTWPPIRSGPHPLHRHLNDASAFDLQDFSILGLLLAAGSGYCWELSWPAVISPGFTGAPCCCAASSVFVSPLSLQLQLIGWPGPAVASKLPDTASMRRSLRDTLVSIGLIWTGLQLANRILLRKG